MSANFKGFLKPLAVRLKSRLSRKIILWVFASIVVIEAIILIPSINRRERELLAQIKEVSSGKVAWILITYPQASMETLLSELTKVGQRSDQILGGAIYDVNGKQVGTFGEPPELSLSDINYSKSSQPLSRKGSRYDDVVWWGEGKGDTVIIRHDASDVQVKLLIYIVQFIGIVALISAVITATVFISLELILITPIFQLRRNLLAAGKAIYDDSEPPEFYSAPIKRQDELGDVIAAFKQMFGQISEAISERKQAQAALQQSLETVKSYSQALDRELEIGREIQQNFLPTQDAINSVSTKSGWEIATFFKPARRVAGDFYDVFELPCNDVGLVIGDVCDKGVGAALFMGLFRSLIRIFSGQTELEGLAHQNDEACALMCDVLATSPVHINPLKAVKLTSDYIAYNHGEMGMFATLFFGVLDPSKGIINYINAGHESLFILDSGGGIKEELKSTGPAVGIMPDMDFQIQQTRLEPGDILLSYTDGVSEARSCNREFFGKERLLSILKENFSSANAMLEKISDSVLEHSCDETQSDDITLLAVRRKSEY
jgi:sigma-B regulation protein RsbU (phosphoserine phosphatase)